MDSQSKEILWRKYKIKTSEGFESQCYDNATAKWLQILGWLSYISSRNSSSAEEEPWQTKIHFKNRIGLFHTNPQDKRFKDQTFLDRTSFHWKKS